MPSLMLFLQFCKNHVFTMHALGKKARNPASILVFLLAAHRVLLYNILCKRGGLASKHGRLNLQQYRILLQRLRRHKCGTCSARVFTNIMAKIFVINDLVILIQQLPSKNMVKSFLFFSYINETRCDAVHSYVN